MSKKLLLADDSITIQKVIGITFANEDYELTVVDNGDTALAKAREIHPDLILADVFMPGKNGYDLCSAIKQDPDLKGVPVLLLSGTFEPFDEEKARSCGAESWIAKPFESQALIDRVEQLLSAVPAPAATPPVAPSPPPETPAAVAAAPPPAEEVSAGSDWEDFDAPEVATAVEVAATEGPAAPVDDPWGSIAFEEDDLQPAAPELEEEFLFEEEDLFAEPVAAETAAPAPAATPAPPAATVVAKPAEPDWGDLEEEILPLDESDILDAEELTDEENEEFTSAVEEAVEQATEGTSAEEEFFFEEESLEQAAEALEIEDPFADEPDTAMAAASEAWEFPAEETTETAEPAAAESDDWAFDLAEEPEPEPVVPPAVTVAAPEVPKTPAAEPVAEPAPVGVEERVASLSEADLEKIVAKVAGAVVERLAGSILEKIAWEVVPDLAEALIRDEIRKIKKKTA
ncbi:hypothetical protein JCM30471_36080 [Desulfuromonas carbonis]|uniref:response regulator n=1 Tax=Desulfuromonas sp. DDH964 TaxID=1823759 RepID=UPI00078E0F23|nr:response regulator [Desulfuromonas sp. DDH964]AMV72964.1 response regulator [Desulfuromonas sp. DDH964]